MLSGNIEWEDIPDDPEIRAWVKSLIRKKEEKYLPPIQGSITTREFKYSSKAAKDNTSSSPSEIDYIIWKCIARDDKMAEIFAKMMSLPFEYGFNNERWCRATDLMLKKSKGYEKYIK